MPAVTLQQGFDLALQHHQAGRLADAEALYRQILAVQSNHAASMHNLGVIARQRGQHDLAMQWIEQAIALDPNDATAHSNLGAIYRSRGRLDEAIACLQRAAALEPNRLEKHNDLGTALVDRGRLDEAEATFRRALALQPDCAEAHSNLGIILAKQGRSEAAFTAYQRALALKPDNAEAHNNLASLLLNLGRLDEAATAYRTALRFKPDYAAAHYNLANLLARRGELDESIVEFRKAIALQPDYVDAHNNLGVAFANNGQAAEAIAAYRRAIGLDTTFADAHTNIGNVLQSQGHLDEAIAAHRRALELNPNLAETHSNLGNALKDQGRMEEAIAEYRQALRLRPESAAMHGNLVYTLHFLPGPDRRLIAEERVRWNQRFSDPVPRLPLPQEINRDPERRLRIGYISPDFSGHVVGRNLHPLFRCHDHRDFEIVCYSEVLCPDSLTEEFRQRSDRWRQTAGLSDDALAAMIRQDGVDILVDLTQHMNGNRLPVFARQPAPLQVSFAGYPDSTGIEAIGCRISDRWLEAELGNNSSLVEAVVSTAFPTAPGGCHSRLYNRQSEQVFLLDSFWCYEPCGMEIAVNGSPAQENGRVTFGSLNNFCKINDPLLRLWARILENVPDSRLVLLSGTGSHRQRTVEFLEHEGIAQHRIEFLEPRPRAEYLEYYHRLDAVLDPYPYNGHTTSLDALWMGVPVITRTGDSAVSRAGFSQLSNLGLRDLVAFSDDEYVQIATQLASDLPRLSELRTTLRSRMETSVLMNAPRFARGIENAYRAMWQA